MRACHIEVMAHTMVSILFKFRMMCCTTGFQYEKKKGLISSSQTDSQRFLVIDQIIGIDMQHVSSLKDIIYRTEQSNKKCVLQTPNFVVCI